MLANEGEPATVDLRRDGPLAWLTLNRPDRLNAFSAQLHADLAKALDELESDLPRVLVISGSGRGFCSGADIAERLPAIEAGQALNLGASLDERYNPLIRRLSALPFPVIAAVNGIAAGAGVSLALAADIVIAAESARFVMAFSNVGLAPDAGLSWTLPRLIGKSRALGLLLTGGSLTASEALDAGIVWQVVADDALLESSAALAHKLVGGSAQAQASTKRLISDPAPSLDEQLDRERDAQESLGRSLFYRQAVLGFAERRSTKSRVGIT